MQRTTAKWLHDAATACNEARALCGDMTRDQFVQHRVVQLAVQKLVENVGEASRHAEELDPAATRAIP
jgi:uncharacterized protein with HEPN domain